MDIEKMNLPIRSCKMEKWWQCKYSSSLIIPVNEWFGDAWNMGEFST